MPQFEKWPRLPEGWSYRPPRRAEQVPQRRAEEPAGESAAPGGAGRRAYPSDLTDAQWALIAPHLPGQPPGSGRPRTEFAARGRQRDPVCVADGLCLGVPAA